MIAILTHLSYKYSERKKARQAAAEGLDSDSDSINEPGLEQAEAGEAGQADGCGEGADLTSPRSTRTPSIVQHQLPRSRPPMRPSASGSAGSPGSPVSPGIASPSSPEEIEGIHAHTPPPKLHTTNTHDSDGSRRSGTVVVTPPSPMSPTNERMGEKSSLTVYPPRAPLSERRGTGTTFSSMSRGHVKAMRKLPWRAKVKEGRDGPWLEEHDEATEWLNLFYDLTVVAVLSVFSSTHEIANPDAIGIYFSYYIILSWIWSSQVHYDVRFQGEDRFHRTAKAFQIMVFVYMGAASGGWNPGGIRNYLSLEDQTQAQIVEHQQAANSWLTVMIAFILYRALLSGQYAWAIYDGHKAKRRLSGMWISFGALITSMVLAILSAAIPANTQGAVIAKITLFYLGIFIETYSTWAQLYKKRHGHIKTEAVGERYGAFTLIILGEGFINLTRSFSSAITGLSTSSSSTYAQVFVAISIIFLVWTFLFAYFRQSDEIDMSRAIMWEMIHFPLHFVLLLLLAAIVNTIIVTSFSQGLTNVAGYYNDALNGLLNNTRLPEDTLNNYAYYIDKLEIYPSFIEQYEILWTYTNQTGPPPEDVYVLGYQYYAQLLLASCTSYGVEVGDAVAENVNTLYALNTTYLDNSTARADIEHQAGQLVLGIATDLVNDALTGTLWLFPVAGGVLILSAIRSMLWYRFRGAAHWIVHGVQIGIGLALGLLGLLDIGNRTVDVVNGIQDSDVNPFYKLLEKDWPLPIVDLVYFIVFSGTQIILNLWHRHKGGIYDEEDKTQ